MSLILLFTLVPVFIGGLFGSIILLNLHNALIYDLIIEDIKKFIDRYIFFIPRKIRDIFLGWFNLIWSCLKNLWSYVIKAKNYLRNLIYDLGNYLTNYKNIIFSSGASLGRSWLSTITKLFKGFFYTPIDIIKRVWIDRGKAWKAFTSGVSEAWGAFNDKYGSGNGILSKINDFFKCLFGDI